VLCDTLLPSPWPISSPAVPHLVGGPLGPAPGRLDIPDFLGVLHVLLVRGRVGRLGHLLGQALGLALALALARAFLALALAAFPAVGALTLSAFAQPGGVLTGVAVGVQVQRRQPAPGDGSHLVVVQVAAVHEGQPVVFLPQPFQRAQRRCVQHRQHRLPEGLRRRLGDRARVHPGEDQRRRGRRPVGVVADLEVLGQ
jgi:hypothetical protein